MSLFLSSAINEIILYCIVSPYIACFMYVRDLLLDAQFSCSYLSVRLMHYEGKLPFFPSFCHVSTRMAELETLSS